MTSLPASTTRSDNHADARLRQHVARSARRGQLIATLGGLLIGCACLVLGLLALVAADAFEPMPGSVRLAVLGVILLGSFGLALCLAIGPWRSKGRELAAAEHIEQAAGLDDQPVVRGLSLRDSDDADALAVALHTRAKQRAADLAVAIDAGRAYPASALRRQGRWLWLACVGWLIIALVFPSQLFAVFSRALTPWVDAPPFSLTELEPTWQPEAPTAGDDVTVTVDPQGLQPEQVDFVRLDDQGNELERIAMAEDGQGGFSHTLNRVEEPIDFKLEANGRATKTYTIDPTPREPEAAAPEEQNEPDDPGGTTQYDPDAVEARDNPLATKWDGLLDNISDLLADLAGLQARAEAIDPTDAEALAEFAEELEALNARAEALAGDLNALQGELPAEAASSLARLHEALSQMQVAGLPPSPGSSPSNGGTESEDPSQTPTPADWLSQAANAASEDQSRIAQGVGQSELPTESGTTTAGNGENAPHFTDPTADGGYDEEGISGDDGPLPAAVMQQVPPSYRKLITAYFNRLAEPETDDAP